MNITILASGSGSNFQAILNAIDNRSLTNVTIQKVIADRECQAINRAIQNKIPFEIISRRSPNFKSKLTAAIPPTTDLIVLAGFLSILPQQLIETFKGKIINIHPSLLPKYGGKGMYGMHVHNAVKTNQEVVSGCTVHFVDTGIDTGTILLQKQIELNPKQTAEDIQQVVLAIEHQLLPLAIQVLQLIYQQLPTSTIELKQIKSFLAKHNISIADNKFLSTIQQFQNAKFHQHL